MNKLNLSSSKPTLDLDVLEYSYRVARGEQYEGISRGVDGSKPESRLEFMSTAIFGFQTYESGMDELFASKAVEVCDALTNSKTFDYIGASTENRTWYLLMCNLPFFADRIEWGSSIRGAWWCHEILFSSSDLFEIPNGSLEERLKEGDRQIAASGPLMLSREEWLEFMRSVVEFAALDMAEPHAGVLE